MITIQMDTREKTGKKDHILRAFERAGVDVIRSKLYVGDYTLLNDQSVCVDVKQGLQEVYGNLVQDHERFRAEAKRAQEHGIRLVVLVESGTCKTLDDVAGWYNPRIAMWQKKKTSGAATKPPVSSPRLMRMMKVFAENYGVQWRFCPHQCTGDEIIKILTGEEKNHDV